jgi:hypothetical protein
MQGSGLPPLRERRFNPIEYRRWGSAMPGECAGWRNSPCQRAREKEIRVKGLELLDFLSKKQRNNSGRNSG